MKQRFRSKVDWWYYLVMLSIPALVITPALATSSPADDTPSIVVCLIGLAIPVWLLVSTNYTIEDDELTVRCGPFKWNILISDIQNIERTRTVMSSPALSLDRIKIDYAHGNTVIVSPKNQEEFIGALRGV